MCSETQPEAAVPTTANPLTGVLTPNVPPIPKASLSVKAVEMMKSKHEELISRLATAPGITTDENSTLHVTAEAPYLSSNTSHPLVGQDKGTVAVLGPTGALAIEVTPPPPPSSVSSSGGMGIDLEDVWKFALTFLPLALLASSEEPAPIANFDVSVTGSTAQIVRHEVGSGFNATVGLGVDIGCILSAGGGSILSVIVRCLQFLPDIDAFKSALLAALGPAGVDLVSRLMKCF
jgi:hypothetical protein